MKKNNAKVNWILLSQMNFWIGSLLLVLIFSGCYERVEGCLDVYATNFNANADDPCEDDCCNYPNLIFTINHLMGEVGLRYDTTLYGNGFDDSIRIVQITYFISEVELLGTSGNLSIRDTVRVTNTEEESFRLTDDFTLVDYIKGRNYTIGGFQTAGTYDSLTLRLGLNNEVAKVNPSSLSTGHNLSIQSDTMWQDPEGYAFAKISLVSQANNSDTLEYFIPATNNSLKITLPVSVEVDFGTNSTLLLDVDYQKWLQGIDFAAIGNDKDAVLTQIVNNLPNSISITE